MLTESVLHIGVVFENRWSSEQLQSSHAGVSDDVDQCHISKSDANFDNNDADLNKR